MTARIDLRDTQEHAKMELDILRRREAVALAEVATSNADTELAQRRERSAIRASALKTHVLEAISLAEVEMFSLRLIRQGNHIVSY